MGILQMSISAGFLVVAIVVIRAVALNKLPKSMFLILWGVVLLRLILPVSLPPLFNLYNIMGWNTIPTTFSNTASADANVSLSDNLAATGSMAEGVAAQIPTQVSERVKTAGQLSTEVHTALGRLFFDQTALVIIWVTGMLALFLFFVLIYLKNRRQLRCALPASGSGFLDEWLAEHRLMRKITILQSDRTTTPLAVGLAKPRVILPKSMDMEDKALMNYVLTHEYYHIKRFDMLWKLLLALALCLHWFNPLVWVMYVIVSRDLELTCDEMVIRRFGADTRKSYAYSLIGMAEQRSKISPLYIGYSKNAVEERITSIMKYKKSSVASIVLAAFLVIGTTTAFALSGINTGADNDNPDAAVGQVDTSTTIKLANLDTDQAKYHIGSVDNVTSRPEFEFNIEGEDIAKIELSSENEYLYIVDWTGTQTDPYSKDAIPLTSGVDIDKKATLVFDEGFTDYDKIQYRWWGESLYTWACEDNYSHFLGIGGAMGNVTPLDGASEQDKLKLATGDDGLGTTGVGHIQVEGYPEELLMDRITVKFTDREGNVTTRYIDISVRNDELRQLVVTASLKD